MTTPSARLRLPASGLPISTLLGAALLLLTGAPAAAQEAAPWTMTVYLQQSWPKQTETNRQIKDINAATGQSFKTWDDVANLNLGLQLFRDLDPRWKVGLELDYSRGKIDGAATVDTFVGPATLSFEQKYTVYADLLVLAQFRPLGKDRRVIPFLQGGLGLAYEKDRTLLTLRNPVLDETLIRVDNDGWFPMYTLGVGVDVYFSEKRTWYAEAGVSYTWARLKHDVAASGSLAPPTVTADTDSTGPNVWLGIGRRF
ncbi:MAG TPA: outer membrane beta-barrel protein [Geothrix sp.]|nr:outer membrane beta-barrel protein [Geothrix sp.]